VPVKQITLILAGSHQPFLPILIFSILVWKKVSKKITKPISLLSFPLKIKVIDESYFQVLFFLFILMFLVPNEI